MERLSPGRMKPTKKQVTTVIRPTAMTSMMATSLPKIDVCRWRGLFRAASNERVAGAADGADERRSFGVVAELLAQDDGHADVLAHLAADGEPVHLGQHDVEDEDGGLAVLQRPQSRLGMRCRRHGEAEALQILREKGVQALVVVDDQDVGGHGSLVVVRCSLSLGLGSRVSVIDARYLSPDTSSP